eukprot:6176437-Pleurochrysis_carterae.AAC.1
MTYPLLPGHAPRVVQVWSFMCVSSGARARLHRGAQGGAAHGGARTRMHARVHNHSLTHARAHSLTHALTHARAHSRTHARMHARTHVQDRLARTRVRTCELTLERALRLLHANTNMCRTSYAKIFLRMRSCLPSSTYARSHACMRC